MAEIIPAVLPKSFDELSDTLSFFPNRVRTVHLDICDGRFVPAVSWPKESADSGIFTAILQEQEGLPRWKEFDFEAHLMVENPERDVEQWVQAGVSRIIVHQEAIRDFEKLSSLTRGRVELYLSLKLETPLSAVDAYKDRIDGLQLMSIARIGEQGIPFEQSVLQKIRDARAKFPALSLSVDGGVSDSNAMALIQAGASQLVVGSAIVGSIDPAGSYETIQNAIQ